MIHLQHIFFDLDNTLWDHRRNAKLTLQDLFAEEQMSEKFGLDFEDFHREYFTINESLWAQLRDGEITKDELRVRRFYESLLFFGIEDRALAARLEANFLDEILRHNHLLPGTVDLLENLKSKGYTLHILSNGFAEVTQRKAALSGIAKYFTTITSADEINMRKPAPEIFDLALHKAEASREASIMIGDDWVADVEGALAYGLPAIFLDVFRDGYQAEGVTVIQELREIAELI